jgi:hypothetical protein
MNKVGAIRVKYIEPTISDEQLTRKDKQHYCFCETFKSQNFSNINKKHTIRRAILNINTKLPAR